MTYYRAALLLFVVGNVVVFTSFMRITGIPWSAFMVFIGYIFTNAPVVVSFLAAQRMDRTLKGHWLNWLNILIPTAAGAAGLVAYTRLALHPDAHPQIFMFGPLLITAGWFVMVGILIMIYVFTDR